MVILIKLNKSKAMRSLIFCLLISFNYTSIAQKNFEKKIDSVYRLGKVFDDKFEMYISNCSDSSFNKVVTKIVADQKHITSELPCMVITDSLLFKKIYRTLLGKEELKGKMAFVNSMLYQGKTYYFYVLLFTTRSLKRYNCKKSKEKISIEHPTGEIKIRHEAALSKYAHSYILEDKEESLMIDDIK